MTDTERIDLDELETGDSDSEDDQPTRGDWLWSDDETAPDEPTDVESAVEKPTDAESESESSSDSSPESTEEDDSGAAIPRVPRENDDKPVGIPVERGGAGAGPEPETPSDPGEPAPGDAGAEPATQSDSEPAEPRPMSTADYHGADVDDMTMAVTYNAVRRLAEPDIALNSARGWADWIGIVGDVAAPAINKFQREHQIDADFFNGTGSAPGERLASIDRNSMFFAERLVVVGVKGEDEAIAAEADWEFVPLSEAAEKAGWELVQREDS